MNKDFTIQCSLDLLLIAESLRAASKVLRVSRKNLPALHMITYSIDNRLLELDRMLVRINSHFDAEGKAYTGCCVEHEEQENE